MRKSSSGGSSSLLRHLLTSHSADNSTSSEKPPSNSKSATDTLQTSDKDVCLPTPISEPPSQAPTGDSELTEDSQQWLNSADMWQAGDLDFDSVILQSGVDLGISNLTMKEITNQVLRSSDIKEDLSPSPTYSTEDAGCHGSDDEQRNVPFTQSISAVDPAAAYAIQQPPQTYTNLQTIPSQPPAITGYSHSATGNAQQDFTQHNLPRVASQQMSRSHVPPPTTGLPSPSSNLDTSLRQQQLLYDRNMSTGTLNTARPLPSNPPSQSSSPQRMLVSPNSEVLSTARAGENQPQPFVFTSTSGVPGYSSAAPRQPYHSPNYSEAPTRETGVGSKPHGGGRPPSHPVQFQSNYDHLSISIDKSRSAAHGGAGHLHAHSTHSSPSLRPSVSPASTHSTLSTHSPQLRQPHIAESARYVSPPINQPPRTESTHHCTQYQTFSPNSTSPDKQQTEKTNPIPAETDLNFDPSTFNNNMRRMQYTEQLLRSCGLYETTLLTGQMVHRDKQINSEIDDLRQQLELLTRDVTGT